MRAFKTGEKRWVAIATSALVLAAGGAWLWLSTGAFEKARSPADPSPSPALVQGTAIADPGGARAENLPRYAQGASRPGGPNRLAHEKSAYLRSAAHQPIDWHPWGEEAFEKARKEDKLILLDVGAVWCHWCHVMDRESYENPEIARLINRYFVAIKVDRDERPDIDRRYMDAVVALTGAGGWPLTAFLTPQGKAFFGGTYFPPDDKFGRPGLKSLLPRIAQVYRERKKEVLADAHRLEELLGRQEAPTRQEGLSSGLVEAVVQSLREEFDPQNGGFGKGGGPKFPAPGAIELALYGYFRTQDPQALALATQTLKAMAQGGIHDHIGGGFHRYSVDPSWRVPHFEKMLTDNAGLLKNSLHVYHATGEALFREVAEGILAYVDRSLSDRQRGGFYAFQDADIDLKDDGDYWTWTKQEIEAIMSRPEHKAFVLAYDIREKPGHLPDEARAGRHVLFLSRPPEKVARELGLPVEKVEGLLRSARQRLLEVRNRRPAPFVDRSVFSDLNGQMVSAYLEAYKVLGREDVRDFALKTLDRLMAHAFQEEKGMAHVLDEGNRSRVWGLLADQIWMGLANLEAFEVTGEARYLRNARTLMEIARETFWDRKNGGFLDRTPDPQAPGVLNRPHKDLLDSPTPSVNAVAALALDRLSYLTNDLRYARWAEETLRPMAGSLRGRGTFAATAALAVAFHIDPPAHAVIIGRRSDPRAQALVRTALSAYRPGKVVSAYAPDRFDAQSLPAAVAALLASADPKSWTGPKAYVCSGAACALPTDDPKQVVALLRSFGR